MRVNGIWRLAIAATLVISGCKKDSTGPDGGTGGGGTLTIALSNATVTIDNGPGEGADGTVTATIHRGGDFTGSVTITITGVPNGLDATASPSSISAGNTTSQIQLHAGPTLAAGNYTLTIHAAGSGVSDATVTLAVTVTEVSPGTYTLSVDPASLTIQQGNQGSATVGVNRSGYTGDVAFTISGLPSGLTAAFDPTSTTGNSSTLTLTVGGSVAASDYTLTIKGTATGLEDQTTSLAVTVEEAASGGSGNTSWQFCPLSGLPVWFAFQDGSGPWTQVQPDADNKYTFDINSGRGGVAIAMTPSGQATVQIQYGTQAELNQQGVGICGGSSVGKTINGSVANVGLTEQAYISLGGAASTVLGASGINTFQIMNVPDGTVDLVASRAAFSTGGSGPVIDFNKGIIWRDLNPADGSTLPVLDFESADAFTPVQQNLTINNLGTDGALITESFFTQNGGIGTLYAGVSQSTSMNRTFKTVPSSVTQSGDLNLLTVAAWANGSTSPTMTRSAIAYFAAPADQMVTLGPQMGAVTVSAGGSTPYLMPRIQYTIQNEYGMYFVWGASQSGGTTGHTLLVGATAGYLNGASTFDMTMPDFSPAGFDAALALDPGVQTTWTFAASGWTGGGTGIGGVGPGYLDGVLTLSGTRIGTTVF